jgi:hypothetical protein
MEGRLSIQHVVDVHIAALKAHAICLGTPAKHVIQHVAIGAPVFYVSLMNPLHHGVEGILLDIVWQGFPPRINALPVFLFCPHLKLAKLGKLFEKIFCAIFLHIQPLMFMWSLGSLGWFIKI